MGSYGAWPGNLHQAKAWPKVDDIPDRGEVEGRRSSRRYSVMFPPACSVLPPGYLEFVKRPSGIYVPRDYEFYMPMIHKSYTMSQQVFDYCQDEGLSVGGASLDEVAALSTPTARDIDQVPVPWQACGECRLVQKDAPVFEGCDSCGGILHEMDEDTMRAVVEAGGRACMEGRGLYPARIPPDVDWPPA